MPLLDHFHGALDKRRHWESFHSHWANVIATLLNREVLPERYVAEPQVSMGILVESDVAAFDEQGASTEAANGIATATYAPPKPPLVAAVDLADLDVFEVQIYREEGGPKLVAAIELVSPANKDREATRQAFVRKCASYLQSNVSVVMVDVVTSRSAILNFKLLEALGQAAPTKANDLYAAAYRIVRHGQKTRLEGWPESLALGKPLPTLPLWIAADMALPLDLEQSYLESCEDLRIDVERGS